MSFNIAMTGLSAVNEQLNTISHNIANAGTTGFKSSRTEFGSIYADIDQIEEMTDMMSATRSFENSVEVLNRLKSMQQGLLKLGES